MRFTVELDCKPDGQWIAVLAEMPGIKAQGQTRMAAAVAALELAFEALEDLDDAQAARDALADPERIPYEQVRDELDL